MDEEGKVRQGEEGKRMWRKEGGRDEPGGSKGDGGRRKKGRRKAERSKDVIGIVR